MVWWCWGRLGRGWDVYQAISGRNLEAADASPCAVPPPSLFNRFLRRRAPAAPHPATKPRRIDIARARLFWLASRSSLRPATQQLRAAIEASILPPCTRQRRANP